MRSALSLFSPMVKGDDGKAIRAGLRWLTKELDAARNWDVFVTQILAIISRECAEEHGLERLRVASEDIRQQYRRRAREALASSRYQKLLLQVGAWLCTRPWEERLLEPNNGGVAESIPAFSARVLQRQHKQLKKRYKHLVIVAPHARHQLRIAAKKSRYVAEFFSSLYARKRVRRYIAALAQVQDVLGGMNDAVMAEVLVRELRQTKDEQTREATSLVLGWTRGTNYVQREQLDRAWCEFKEQKVFW